VTCRTVTPSAWAQAGAWLEGGPGAAGWVRSRADRCRRGTVPLSWGAVTEDGPRDVHLFEEIAGTRFPGLLGIEVLEVASGRTRMRLDIEPKHLAPNGYLHAGVVVGLADSACGYGCVASFPAGVTNFATIELKTNFLGTATDGSIECVATLTHGGRTTQVWDAEVTASDRVIALFRCTQLLLSPRT
jgi:uncharacterized protein (TIGR00369 family)